MPNVLLSIFQHFWEEFRFQRVLNISHVSAVHCAAAVCNARWCSVYKWNAWSKIYECMGANKRKCWFCVCFQARYYYALSPPLLFNFPQRTLTFSSRTCAECILLCKRTEDETATLNRTPMICVRCVVGVRMFFPHIYTSIRKQHTFTSTHPCGCDYTKSV